MSQNYLTFYEAYDANGGAVYSANAFTTSQSSQLTKSEFEQHYNYVLKHVQGMVPSAVTLVFKGIFKL